MSTTGMLVGELLEVQAEPLGINEFLGVIGT